jgi:hypothetical protein
MDRRARLQYERAFLEMSSQVRRLLSMASAKFDAYVLCAALEKCTCGAISAKKLGVTPQPLLAPPQRSLPPPLPPPSTSLPPSPAAPVPAPSIVDGGDRTAAQTTPVVVETTTNKPREPRREREGENVGAEGESAPKRRKITPSPPPRSAPVSAPSSTPPSTAAPPTPVSDVVSTPEVAKVVQVVATQSEETVVVVPADKDRASAAVSAENHHPHQSAPGPECDSTLPEPEPKPKPAQEQEPDPSVLAETDNDDVVSARRKIGIQHIQLVYETVGETLQCRMCLYGALPLVHIY